MNELYENDIIYKIDNQPSKVDSLTTKDYLVIGKENDFNENGKSKLLEILAAIGWKENENCSIKTLESEEQFLLANHLNHGVTKVISFGLTDEELGLQSKLPNYYHAKFEKALLIKSDSIEQIINDKQLKIQLWNSIKDLKE